MIFDYWPCNINTPGLSNFSAIAGRIDFILGLAGHYARTVYAMDGISVCPSVCLSHSGMSK